MKSEVRPIFLEFESALRLQAAIDAELETVKRLHPHWTITNFSVMREAFPPTMSDQRKSLFYLIVAYNDRVQIAQAKRRRLAAMKAIAEAAVS